jgi:hypothetical protein
MKTIIITILICISIQSIAQSLAEPKDETIYIKGNSKVYIGINEQKYAYSVIRNYYTSGLVMNRTLIDTTTDYTLQREYYSYNNTNKITSYNKDTFDIYTNPLNSYHYEIAYDSLNNRLSYRTTEHRDSISISPNSYKYDVWIHISDHYYYNNNQITMVIQEISDDRNKVFLYGSERFQIKWLDYKNELMSNYDINKYSVALGGSYDNRVFFKYKDQYGSYDQTEKTEVSYGPVIWQSVHRYTRNYDQQGLNSITEADTINGQWVISKKISYTYKNNKLSTITTVLSRADTIYYIQKEVFDDSPSNLRKADAIAMLTFDERDIKSITATQDELSSISMYPNPSIGYTNIMGLSNNYKTINFINCQGQIAYTTNTNQSNVVIDYPFNSGMYIVQVIEQNKITRLSNLIVQ